MSSSLLDPLYRAAALTFEEMALLYATPRATPIVGDPEAEVAVAFTGPLRGSVLVRTFGRVLPVVAANMLGEEGEPGRQLQQDALGEMANVICGNLLPVIGGPDALFRLDAPAVAPAAALGADALPRLPVAGIALDVECGSAEVLLFLGDAGVPAGGP